MTFSQISLRMNTFNGEKLKAIRKERHLTQGDIAEVLGLTKQAISRIENGDRSITVSENRLLNLFFFGNIPDGMIRADGVLSFEGEEWTLIEGMARREGYENGKTWIVAKIRAYLAQLPDSVKQPPAAKPV